MHATKYHDEDEAKSFDIDHVPECLQQYLITVQEPREIYKSVDQTHNQRLRLLLRRFTNQIQYGCTNPHCNVPTCLSYRKRNAGGPVRPYTDVAARALAVKCVERCASSGCLSEILKRDKGRNGRSLSSSGLCWNEPVLPWYSHSDDPLRRRHVVNKRAEIQQNGTPTKPSPKRTHVGSNGHIKSPKCAAEPDTVTASEPDTQPNVDGLREAQRSPDNQDDNTDEVTLQQVSGSARSKSSGHVNGSLSELLSVPRCIVQRKKDPASLSQFIFDDPRLRTFEDAPEHKSRSVKSANHSPNAHQAAWARTTKASRFHQSARNVASEDDDAPGAHRREQSETREYFQILNACTTFRLLPASAFLWLKSLVLKHKMGEPPPLPPWDQEGSSPTVANIEAFIEQSLYFTFSDPHRLILSAATWDHYALPDVWSITRQDIKDLSQTEFEPCRSRKTCLIPMWGPLSLLCRDILWLLHAIRYRRNSYDDDATAFQIIKHMMAALRKCYYCPPFTGPQSPSALRYRSNAQVAHLLVLVLNITLGLYQGSSDAGYSETYCAEDYGLDDWGPHGWLRIEHLSEASDPALSQITTSMADLISHRIAIDMARKARSPRSASAEEEKDIVTCIISILCNPPIFIDPASAQLNCHPRLLELMQAVIHAEWDRAPFVRYTGPVGGALEVLRGMHKHRRMLRLTNDKFEVPSVGTALDEVDMPYEWLSHHPDVNKTHILEYPFLFTPTQIVRYFRSLNLQIMKHSHEKAMGVHNHGKHQLVRSTWRVNGLVEVLDKIRVHMARYFVVTISRDNVLEDAIGQVWRRERQELLRPLKVRLGKGEGEEGLDHGGVQQEFFRLVFADVFDPRYGMFDTDSTTRMTWFKPSSLEPLYRFEALGILTGLAIYNGVTVPITMPLAFYMKMLGLDVKAVTDIEDGWPELAKGFTIMLAWQDGDVGDVIARTYEFTYEAFGEIISIDMSKTMVQQTDLSRSHNNSKGKEKASSSDKSNPKPESNTDRNGIDLTNAHLADVANCDSFAPFEAEEAPLVTNANREAFVSDYINHLTKLSIQPQLTAFLRGLHTIISPRSLSLFTHSPSTLKLLVEGHPLSQSLDIDGWFTTTTYEDYDPSDSIIIWFWDILRGDFTQSQLRKLLEFVTASDRIPVNGWEGVTFIVQRNGEGDERLPGSSTCYGRLLLPSYSTKEVLKEKLEKAVENSLGFGVL